MKKLAIISSHPIQYNAPLFRMLNARGKIEIKVFYTWEKDSALYDRDFGREIRWDIPLLNGYEYEFVPNYNKKRNFWGVKNPDLEKVIKKWNADAVLIYGWSYLSHLRSMLHFRHKIPVFFRGDSTMLDDLPGIKAGLRKIFLRWVYRHVDKALYAGKSNYDYFRKLGLTGDKLIFMPHAVDNDRFSGETDTIKSEALQWRKQLGIASGDIVFLFAGKFLPKKDPLLLIEAFLKMNRDNCHLVLLGEGILKDQMLEKSKNNPHIHILPFQNQSQMPVVYQLCDVFCLPSRGPGETWGLAVNEAMSGGKAILVSDKVGCGPDLVFNHKNGYVFKAGDLNDLLEKLNLFTEHKLASMGNYSREVIKRYSFSHQAEAVETALIQ